MVDRYHCDANGLSLLYHSELDVGAQGTQIGGLYQGLALPRSINPGAEWEYSYVLAGGDPTNPPEPSEVRYHVTEHFKVLGPGIFSAANGQQLPRSSERRHGAAHGRGRPRGPAGAGGHR